MIKNFPVLILQRGWFVLVLLGFLSNSIPNVLLTNQLNVLFLLFEKKSPTYTTALSIVPSLSQKNREQRVTG